MVTFKNNNSNRRNNFRRSERPYRNNNDRVKINNGFSSSENFQRKPLLRNVNSISKLIDKYSNLAREALSTGDKILSENYFQHADHFTRILTEQEIQKKSKFSEDRNSNSDIKTDNNDKIIKPLKNEDSEETDNIQSEIN